LRQVDSLQQITALSDRDGNCNCSAIVLWSSRVVLITLTVDGLCVLPVFLPVCRRRSSNPNLQGSCCLSGVLLVPTPAGQGLTLLPTAADQQHSAAVENTHWLLGCCQQRVPCYCRLPLLPMSGTLAVAAVALATTAAAASSADAVVLPGIGRPQAPQVLRGSQSTPPATNKSVRHTTQQQQQQQQAVGAHTTSSCTQATGAALGG
jgi:hypothetical protein